MNLGIESETLECDGSHHFKSGGLSGGSRHKCVNPY